MIPFFNVKNSALRKNTKIFQQREKVLPTLIRWATLLIHYTCVQTAFSHQACVRSMPLDHPSI